jgi:hypothetical protein
MHIHAKDREDFRRGSGAHVACQEQVGELVEFLVLRADGGAPKGFWLPLTILCSHCYIAFPKFKVKKGDADEVALDRASKLSSDRDLVEEFIPYGVWLPVHG